MSDPNNPKTDVNQDKSNNNRQMPLSRFWACFFSFSIFALLWTGKMQKTRRWIPLFVIFITIWFVLDQLLYPSEDYSDITIPHDLDSLPYIEPNVRLDKFLSGMLNDYFPNNEYLADVISLISLSLIVLYHVVLYIGSLLMIVYFMLKWTTQYNLKHFGYKSKREWKKANLPQRNIGKKIKEHSSKTISNIKDISKKTSEKIPSDKIMETSTKAAEKITETSTKAAEKFTETSTKAAEKITETAKNLKPDFKMSEDAKRKQIREWHDMMTMGVITESEFEKKKEEFLKANSEHD